VNHITISACPRHPKTMAVTFDTATGGMRVTGDKCCGQWNVVRKWPLTADRIADIRACLVEATKALATKEAK
jgi:hypothetical protein